MVPIFELYVFFIKLCLLFPWFSLSFLANKIGSLGQHPYNWRWHQDVVVSLCQLITSCCSPYGRDFQFLTRLAAVCQLAYARGSVAVSDVIHIPNACPGYLISLPPKKETANRSAGAAADGCNILLLYAHGGNFTGGSPLAYLPAFHYLMQKLKAEYEVTLRVLSLDYSLSPEHSFPLAQEQVLAAYQWCVEDPLRLRPDCIVLGGDSAGANLALTAAALLHDRRPKFPKPSALVLISPWVDLTTTTTAQHMGLAQHFDIVSPSLLAHHARRYVGSSDPNLLAHPMVSPINLGSLQDLSQNSRMLILAGGLEVFMDQIRRFAKRATRGGGEVQMHVEEGAVHIFPVLHPYMGESSARGLKVLAKYLANLVALNAATSHTPEPKPAAMQRVESDTAFEVLDGFDKGTDNTASSSVGDTAENNAAGRTSMDDFRFFGSWQKGNWANGRRRTADEAVQNDGRRRIRSGVAGRALSRTSDDQPTADKRPHSLEGFVAADWWGG